jgi:hypothetical protein
MDAAEAALLQEMERLEQLQVGGWAANRSEQPASWVGCLSHGRCLLA